MEVYHDRLREALIALLEPDHRRALHGKIAEALGPRDNADPQALFTHYLAAGDTARAGQYAVLAADRAAQALAFDRAAQLYRQALDLRGDGDRERMAVLVKLGESLANAGRGLDAAEVFENAARLSAQRSADNETTLDLRRRAAELFIRGGHVDRGVAITRKVLGEIGVQYPTSRRQALAAALLMRARLAWRGLRFRVRAEGEVTSAERRRLDVCWGAASSFAMVDEISSEWMSLRHLFDALRVGAPVHVARALGQEVAKTAQLGSRFFQRRCDRLLVTMEGLVRAHGGAYDQAFWHVTAAVVAYQRARWRETGEHSTQALGILRANCRGVAWEIATAEAFALSALAHRGDFRELALRLPVALADADERGDLYPAAGFRNGVPNMLWLAHDQAEQARQQADDGMARWPVTEAFHIQHYLHLIARVQIELYAGDAWAAWTKLVEAWPKLRKALLLSMAGPSVELRNLRARTALAAATDRRQRAITPPDPAWPRSRLLRLAAAEARRIGRNRCVECSRPLALLIEAQIADIRGRHEDALALYARAARGFEAVEMGLYRAAARHRGGALHGGETGTQMQAESIDLTQEQGIRNPEAMLGLCVPLAR